MVPRLREVKSGEQDVGKGFAWFFGIYGLVRG